MKSLVSGPVVIVLSLACGDRVPPPDYPEAPLIPAGLPEDTAAGIQLGMPLAQVESACRQNGQTWQGGVPYSACSGPIAGTEDRWHREVRLVQSDGLVCGMLFEAVADPEEVMFAGGSVLLRLNDKYGNAQSLSPIPAACNAEEVIDECINNGRAVFRLLWEVGPQRWELLQMAREADGVLRLRIGFFGPVFMQHAGEFQALLSTN